MVTYHTFSQTLQYLRHHKLHNHNIFFYNLRWFGGKFFFFECHNHNNWWRKEAVLTFVSVRSETQQHEKHQVGNLGSDQRLLLAVSEWNQFGHVFLVPNIY